MKILHLSNAQRLGKKLKRILQDELGEDTRLLQCYEAIAEGFDFKDWPELTRRVPTPAAWNCDWCVNRLVDEGHVQDESNAREAVARLEARLGPMIDGRPIAPFPVDAGRE